MADVPEILTSLGFGDYESRAYLALLRRNPANGYEVAKASDVPRGNIYAVLQKLEERGAVLRMDTPDGVRYAPVPPDELLDLLRGRFDRMVEAAARALKEAAAVRENAHVWNLEGYTALLEHARAVILAAERELLLAVWPEEARALAEETHAAVDRGVEVRTLCLAGCPQECGACRGKVHRYRMSPQGPEGEGTPHWLAAVADAGEVLAGAAGGAVAPPQGVRTRQQLLVDLTASYIRHSIALAAVVEDLGPELSERLSPETREVLEMVGRADGLDGWMKSMVNSQ